MISTINYQRVFCTIFMMYILSPMYAVNVKLNARNHQNKVILNWITDNELANTTYQIQRSNDNNIWESIQEIEGRNVSELSEYYFSDMHPVIGKNFYRVRTKNDDVEKNYSNIAQVVNQLKGVEKLFLVTPDPVSKMVQIYSADPLEKILVLDKKGKLITIFYEPKNVLDCHYFVSGDYRFLFHKRNTQLPVITQFVSL